MTAKKPEPQEPMSRISGKDWKMAKTATRRSQLPNALKQTYAERMAKTKQLNIARDMAKAMKQEKIDDKRVSAAPVPLPFQLKSWLFCFTRSTSIGRDTSFPVVYSVLYCACELDLEVPGLHT